MKRRDFDSDDGSQAREENGPLPCHKCSKPTPRATLANYGAQCFACYEAYCREEQPRVDVGDKRVDRLGWAKALERRHRLPHHDGLTPPQVAMYRAALTSRRIDDSPPTSEDSRRVDQAKRAAAARVAAYLLEHPEMDPTR